MTPATSTALTSHEASKLPSIESRIMNECRDPSKATRNQCTAKQSKITALHDHVNRAKGAPSWHPVTTGPQTNKTNHNLRTSVGGGISEVAQPSAEREHLRRHWRGQSVLWPFQILQAEDGILARTSQECTVSCRHRSAHRRRAAS